MIRAGIAAAGAVAVGLVLSWLLAQEADARRRRERVPHPTAVARAIDVGPVVVRTLRIDPCEVARTFAEAWKCRVQ
jgi:hypothetical protein